MLENLQLPGLAMTKDPPDPPFPKGEAKQFTFPRQFESHPLPAY